MIVFTNFFKKNTNLLLHLGVAIFIYLFLFIGYRYALWAIQESALFPWTQGFLLSFVDKPGYLGMYMLYFITQFYYYPWLGALILTALLFGSFYACRKLYLRAGFSPLSAYLSAGFVLTLLLSCDISTGNVVYLCLGSLSSIGLFFVLMQSKGWKTYLVLTLASIFMYYVLGAYVYLFASLCVLYFLGGFEEKKEGLSTPDAEKNLKNTFSEAFLAIKKALQKYVFLFILLGILLVTMPLICKEICAPTSPLHLWANLFPTIEMIIMSEGMPNKGTPPIPLTEIFPFLLIPFLILIHPIFNKKPFLSKKWVKISVASVLIVCMVVYTKLAYRHFFEKKSYLEYLAQEGDWDNLLKYCKEYLDNHPEDKTTSVDYHYAQYAKLALLKTKQLNQLYFKYFSLPYMTPLFFNANNKESPVFYSLLSHELGLYVSSFHLCTKQLPHNNLQSTYLVKLLIKNNHALGNYEGNKTHLNLLSSTLFHADFAKKYKSQEHEVGVLFDGKKQNLVYGVKDTSTCHFSSGVIDINVRIAEEAGYQNPMLIEYKMALALLRKDIEYIYNNIHLYKEMGYQYLPVHLEEAVLVYLNYNMPGSPLNSQTIVGQTYKGFGFRPETLARCEYFMKKAEMHQFGELSDKDFLREFKGVYWAYYLYGITDYPTM